MTHGKLLGAAALLLWGTAAGAQVRQQGSNNTLTAQERAEGWQLLFDGTDMKDWRGYGSQELPTGWRVADGEMQKPKSGDDIITRDRYRDFDLQLDWKLTPGGNSGVFYRATEEYPKVYWSGPEYQLLDDARHPDGKSRLTSAGAAYGIYPSPAGYVKPANEWNHTRIVVKGNHVEHWLNGHKMVEYDLGSADWTARVAKAKFAAYPNYGKAPQGYIGIQGDHDGALAIRNVKIRVLK